jgi:hypothetical protein
MTRQQMLRKRNNAAREYQYAEKRWKGKKADFAKTSYARELKNRIARWDWRMEHA